MTTWDSQRACPILQRIWVLAENPESLLQAYDGRVASCIEERLSVESHAIPVNGGRYVLAFRIPDSIKKPHCVRLEGDIYFPIRRERNRYPMDVREIKDLAGRQVKVADQVVWIGLIAVNITFFVLAWRFANK